MITAIGVVVPARDEADRVGDCLRAVQAALDHLPRHVDTAVWVMVDRCTDATARVVGEALAGGPRRGFHLSGDNSPLGTLRHRGSLAVLDLLGGSPPARTWILHTDADTEVPSHWAAAHLRYADRGAHAVAGLAHLDEYSHLHPDALARYRALVDHHRQAAQHRHVYGANLGVRADAYLAVGGFQPMRTGEDADLVHRLERRRFRVERPVDVWVRTSARTQGRASGGLADLLGRLQEAAGCGGQPAQAPAPAGARSNPAERGLGRRGLGRRVG